MKKIWLLLMMILCFLFAEGDAARIDQEIGQIIARQIETCDTLKDQNLRYRLMLDKILSGLNPAQKSYSGVKALKETTENANRIIKKKEKELRGVFGELHSVSNKEAKVVLLQKIANISDDLLIVYLTHRFVEISLRRTFTPLFGQEPPPQETPI